MAGAAVVRVGGDSLAGAWREAEAALAGVLPLAEALSLADAGSRTVALERRCAALGPASLGVRALEWLDARVPGLPARIRTHEPSFSALDKERITGVPCQKTVTLKLGRGESTRYVLVTGAGDFQLTVHDRRALCERLGIARGAAKQARINPPEVPPERYLGLLGGIVSPFLTADDVDLSWLSGMAVVELGRRGGAPVGISLSPFENLVVGVERLATLVDGYWSELLPGIPGLGSL